MFKIGHTIDSLYLCIGLKEINHCTAEKEAGLQNERLTKGGVIGCNLGVQGMNEEGVRQLPVQYIVRNGAFQISDCTGMTS